MISTESLLALNSKAYDFLQTQHLPRGNSMSTPDQTEANTKFMRILVPIAASEGPRWGIQYALCQHRDGAQLEVILLNIGEPITQWQVLRFRTQQEIARFQSERAQAFIEEATKQLATENIPCRGLFKQGDVAFSILDVAEELDCDEIAMPTPKKWTSNFFSRDTVLEVQRLQRDIPVVVVNCEGAPI